MHLYNVTLQKPTGITKAIRGNFSGKKAQEIVIARGQVLELLNVDSENGKISTAFSTEVFGRIRDIAAFRLIGGNQDYVFVGSDSGRLVILQYDAAKNTFQKVHQETYGRSGLRRIIPGEFLAVDAKGRAAMLAAVEKQKLVYVLNRDAQARLTISSPLEAHKPNSFVFSIAGLDVGFENPMFACLEIDYEEADLDTSGEAARQCQQSLTFYELDLGLNHVVRKQSEPLDTKANMLLAVPGGDDGPSGVLVFSENSVLYKKFGEQNDVKLVMPRRRFMFDRTTTGDDQPPRGILIVAAALHRAKNLFFFIVQNELGDVFKLTLDVDDETVTDIKVKYLDTIPVAKSLCVLKSGFLFAASEFGNHYLYQIAYLGENDTEPEFSAAVIAAAAAVAPELQPVDSGNVYRVRELKNLILVDELSSLNPLVKLKIAELINDDTPQFFTLCGRGPKSSLRVLKYGLEVTEMARSELPGTPNAVWTLKQHIDDKHDSLIIVSFVNATLVMSIGESVEEISESGFLGTTPTIGCGLLADDSLIQVYPEGIRHIKSSKRVSEWKSPGRRTIMKCAINSRQVAIALGGGTVVYFEMDQLGQLNEYTDKFDASADVLCMALGRVPVNEQRCKFLAIGLSDSTVRILSVDLETCLQPVSMQALPTAPESLTMQDVNVQGAGTGGGATSAPAVASAAGGGSADAVETAALATTTLFVNVGLTNGVLLRSALDHVTGDLTDTRMRYLGARPVKLQEIQLQSNSAMLALSSRTWLSYHFQGRYLVTPLSYEALDFANDFHSEQCPEGVVAICGNTLRILALEKLGSVFNEAVFRLALTPRQFAVHPDLALLCIIECDHNVLTTAETTARKTELMSEILKMSGAVSSISTSNQAQKDVTAILRQEEDVFGTPRGGQNSWSSCVRLVDAVDGSTLEPLHLLDAGEAAVCCALVRYASRPDDGYVFHVGVGRHMNMRTRDCKTGGGSAAIRCYRIIAYEVNAPTPAVTDGIVGGEAPARTIRKYSLQLMHTTPVGDDVPTAMCAIQGRLAVCLGTTLRIYDLGKKKLLRKCELRKLVSPAVDIQTLGSRLFISTLRQSMIFAKYRAKDNSINVFADDALPRFVTCATALDYRTIVLGDKFGTISVIRLGDAVNDEMQHNDGSFWQQERAYLNGAAQKADEVAHFHVGEMLTSLARATLIPGGNECIVYSTLPGRIGALLPFTSREDYEFYQHLELHMRSERPPLCGRDHLAFRSAYMPCKAVIDGDLCEQYNSMPFDKQRTVASELDRTPNQVAKKLEDMRNRYAF